MKNSTIFSPFHSIRIRVLLVVIILLIISTSLLSTYTLQQFEEATTFEVEHEGILLSNVLESNIAPLAAVGDIPGLQDQIDRLVASRQQNDIEINIIFLEKDTSSIVASNNSDNIEETSSEEHHSLLTALENKQPMIFIGRDDDEEETTTQEFSPAHPDYYLLPGERFLSITTPLIVDERQIGGINLKLSLIPIDQKLATVRWTLQIATLTEMVTIIIGLMVLLNSQIFNPLQRMAEKMSQIAGGDLSQRIAHQGPVNEVGWLAHAFNTMLDKLQATFDREKRFTADVSHELRTPLTALKGRIGMTLNQPRSEADYRATLEKLETEVDRLSRLSTDLLFLARLEQGHLKPHLEEQDFSDLLEAIVDQMRPLADSKTVTLIEQISPDLTLQGDGDYLIRLFINLIDNAIKYTPAGGSVTIQTRYHQQSVQVAIKDTGPGIPPNHLTLLFDRFYRVAEDRSRNSGGAGLGLSIAHEIVQTHGGHLNVQSELAQGTTFTVSLPRDNIKKFS